MNNSSLAVSKIIVGKKLLHNQLLQITDGKILSITAIKESSKREIISGTLAPGFIDIQVNGGGGILFNQTPTVEGLLTIAKAHQQFGTTTWLPTLITDTVDNMKAAADAIVKARQVSGSGIIGVHFEGPHLSVEKNGIHKQQYIRNISEEEIEVYCQKDLGIVMLTIAPENVSTEIIRRLVAEGIIVCLGHSNATYEQSVAALNAGARGFTHLFNAMSQFTSREPGMVGAALNHQESFAGIILDGIHVHSDSARHAFASKSKMILVTDAMPTVGVRGSRELSFDYFGQRIEQINNTLRDENGKLAGSVLDMATAVSNCQSMLGYDLVESLKFSCLNPARLLNIDQQYGTLEIGKNANMILLDDSGKVSHSWIDGEQVYAGIYKET